MERLPEDVVIVTGHNGLATRAELASYVDGLDALVRYVDQSIAEGLSLTEVTDRTPPADVARFIGGNVRMLEAAFRTAR